MGDSSVISLPSERKRITYSEFFDQEFPYYLHIGMSWSEYWELSPYMTVFYRNAHDFHREELNQQLWLQGYYDHMAVATALANGFRKQGASPVYYPNKPLDLFDIGKEEVSPEEEEAKQIEQLKNTLSNLKRKWDSSHPKEGESHE